MEGDFVALGIPPPSGKKRWIVIARATPLRLLHMADPEAILSTGCPDKSGIDPWHRELCNYVVSAEYAHIIDNSRALELRRMKERDTSATIFLPPPGNIPALVSHCRSLRECAASDEVSTAGGWPRHDKVLEKFDVTNANITLLDLAIAAWVVRGQYWPISTLQHWYSDMVLMVLGDAYIDLAWTGLCLRMSSKHGWLKNTAKAGVGVFLCTNEDRSRERREAELKEHEQTVMEESIQKGMEAGIQKGRKRVGKSKEQSLPKNEKGGRPRESNCWRSAGRNKIDLRGLTHLSPRPYNLPYKDNVHSILHFPLTQFLIAPVSDWVVLIGSSDEAMREHSVRRIAGSIAKQTRPRLLVQP
ncbi:hypothetical protein BU17DRAFT_67350 [Hysterangium stoloniferum]|nr:hypothetical protein BU17DRAFT_67350 [Hysterangium stoloniferum]